MRRSPWVALADAFADLDATVSALDGAGGPCRPSRDVDEALAGARRALARFDALAGALRDGRGRPIGARPDAPAAVTGGPPLGDAVWRALSLHDVALATPVDVAEWIGPEGAPTVVPSSAGRELALLVRDLRALIVTLRTRRAAATPVVPAPPPARGGIRSGRRRVPRAAGALAPGPRTRRDSDASHAPAPRSPAAAHARLARQD